MSPKAVIFVIAALLAVQVFSKVESKLDSPLDPIIELAKNVLEYVNKIVDVAFDESEGILKNLLANLDSLRTGAVNLAQKQIQRESELLQKLIEAVKNRSSEANVDILDCLEHIEEEAGDAETKAINTSMACIDTSIEATGKNILTILDDLRQINTDFEEHGKKLDNCKGKLFPFECIKNVVSELGQIALTIPGKIKADANKATLDFAALGFEIFQCTRDASQAMQEANVKVFNDFSQCVYEKEHPEQ